MLCRSKLDLAGSLEGDRINFVQGFSKNARTRVSDQRVVLVGDL
jgi:hypothetical protein